MKTTLPFLLCLLLAATSQQQLYEADDYVDYYDYYSKDGPKLENGVVKPDEDLKLKMLES